MEPPAPPITARAVPAPDPDAPLVARLRERDEAAFVELVERYGPSMRRVARLYVRDDAVAAEVVQEAWLGALEGIDRFEGRSSLKTWLFRILTNRAKTRGVREARSVPVSALASAEASADDPSVDPDRFYDSSHNRWPGHWAAPLRDWESLPDARLLAKETIAFVADAIAVLPPAQREVIRLRDVEGWDAIEVCDLLGLSAVNQRVLLHRARSKVRGALESYVDGAAP